MAKEGFQETEVGGGVGLFDLLLDNSKKTVLVLIAF